MTVSQLITQLAQLNPATEVYMVDLSRTWDDNCVPPRLNLRSVEQHGDNRLKEVLFLEVD